MKLYGACIGTHHLEPMVNFYRKVFGCEPYVDGPDHRFLEAQLIVFDMTGFEADTDTLSAKNSMIYAVDDVDLEFARLKSLGIAGNPPTDKPWGVRSFGIQDPDGNFINFFTNL